MQKKKSLISIMESGAREAANQKNGRVKTIDNDELIVHIRWFSSNKVIILTLILSLDAIEDYSEMGHEEKNSFEEKLFHKIVLKINEFDEKGNNSEEWMIDQFTNLMMRKRTPSLGPMYLVGNIRC